MTNFDFGNINNTSAVSNSQSLKPWEIYEVKFDGIEKEEIKGKKDPEASFHTIKLSFSNSEGKFIKNLFIPRETSDDLDRPEFENKEGHKYQRPSRFEEFKWKLLQLAQVLNPEGFEKLQKVANKIKTMDQFIDSIIKIVNAKKGEQTKIKLTGRNVNGVIYADIPNVSAINHDGDLFVSNNFIGPRVAFTSYEAQQAAAYKSAKPTDMVSQLSNTKVENNSDDIDFDSLAESL